jgi:hypothetical protein
MLENLLSKVIAAGDQDHRSLRPGAAGHVAGRREGWVH